ncbi:MAG: PLP-dependent aminotransferase family protein [Actinobacteria bacterium]|nr:PLP-dependent aminotransferase family protein [Actinomycetota bacterium]
MRVLCLDNRIAPRTALPAERELAAALGVSRTTVAAAYRSLRDTAHIESTRGSGSVTIPIGRTDLGRVWSADGSIDLQQASPPSWPGLAGVISDVAMSATTLVARSGYDILGSTSLRTAIAERYTASGIPTTIDQVLVTAGAQSGIHLVATVLVGRGDRVLIETPTYPHAAEALRRAGGRMVGVPVTTADGWDLDRAQQAFARTLPTLAYLMPDFQNPTGRSMSAQERAIMLDAAARSGTVLLIDETTADLNIDRGWQPEPFGAGHVHGDGARIIRLGSLAKTVWGGLRLGWIRADADIVRRLLAARSAHDLGTPDFEQAVGAALLPRMADILPQRSHVLRQGRDATVTALRSLLPEWGVPDVDGGVSLWVELNAPLSTNLVLDARAHGLHLSAGPRFAVDGGHEGRLRIPFTTTPSDLERAVEILAAGWHRVRSDAPSSAPEPYAAVV